MQKDLDAAVPLVEKAKKALAGLNKKDFDILKSLANPPPAVARCFFAVLNLYVGIDSVDYGIPQNKGKLGVKEEDSWKASKLMMGNPNKFIEGLNDYKALIDDMKIPPNNFKAIQGILADPEFTPEILKGKAEAAAGLCDWL